MPSQERLKKLYIFEPDTGLLISKRTGKPRGTLDSIGRLQVVVDGYCTSVHRIGWVISFGSIPKGYEIDHINHNRSDNRIENLRLVTRAENMKNLSRHRKNKYGCTGIFFDGRFSFWYARIGVNGKFHHLGCFKDKSEAIEARKRAEQKYGFHPNHGK